VLKGTKNGTFAIKKQNPLLELILMKNEKKPTVLVILDGLGYNAQTEYNAVFLAKTPNLDIWQKIYPHAFLSASGEAVGLPSGTIGNSEVGHLTIGAGRIVDQPISIIQKAIDDETFFKNHILNKNMENLKNSGKTLHIMGLLSDASVHSNIKHLFAFLQSARKHGITKIVIHPFLDGRDTPPRSANTYISQLDEKLQQLGFGKIGSIHGRFYAMDRDNNWDRTKKSYEVLTQRQKASFSDWQELLEKNYHNNITDEFIEPTQLNQDAIVKNGDGIIFFNTRPDRARQLTKLFLDSKKQGNIKTAFFITPVQYSKELATDSLYKKSSTINTLMDVLHKNKKTVYSIAETEKYAHVTYFFCGGREGALENETRILVDSIRTKNYVDKPAMSANQITEHVLKSLKTDPKDFYLINYANADMVGHSGNLEATIKAVEFLDHELKKLYEQIVNKMDGTLYITADHGNAEKMMDKKTGQPHTAHTTSPVPFIMIRKNLAGSTEQLPLKQLSDIAPFILKNMGLPIAQEMKRTD